MLKGHVFKKQRFGNEVFALFIDTFLNQRCGIAQNYKNKMEVTASGEILTILSGCVCVRGRFIEEDTSTSLTAGTDTAYCRLVIEIDLSKENTDNELLQVNYKILKGSNNYPTLTQTDIVANNNGIYQYELAQFRTTSAGITDLVDKRTYLDFTGIYAEIQTEYREVLRQLQEELANVEDGSAYVLKSTILSGTEVPSNDLGNDGDIYYQIFS
ncbi:hypothetical protein [Faecalibacillus faecis]|uniref:hypothetical protein n=1 Tax=Faecalibacillus faecis TaxID=1982628 RepID=UPI003865F64B